MTAAITALRAFAALIAIAATVGAQEPPVPASSPPAASQNPSPMVEYTRAHERLVPRDLSGVRATFAGPAGRPVDLLVPETPGTLGTSDIVIHFHGAAWLPHLGAAALPRPVITAVVNLGAGSGAYHRAFDDPAAFDSLLSGLMKAAGTAAGRPVAPGRVTLTAFSAGHGAVRNILRHARHFARVDAVLLLDGMHTSYEPDRTPLAAGGTLDTTNLGAFAAFAREAAAGRKRFIVTHSEIFPGTFASTTETADWLLGALAVRRTPILRWGPRGMQQLSEVRLGGLELMGFAGNTAPDHVDHLHALPELLQRILRP